MTRKSLYRSGYNYQILTVVGVLAFLFALFSEWNDDAIPYSFYIPRFNENESCTPIRTVADIWNSQINHYYNSNGRFVVHFIVQIFCGLWGKIAFAFCNSIVWMLLVYQLSKRSTLTATVIAIFIFWSLPFTPPFQVNYIWTSCAILLWLILFLNPPAYLSVKKNLRGLVIILLLFILSFLIGEMHEGFSIMVGGAILIYFILKRGRFTPVQFALALGFGIGGLVTILAPGNFYRINVMEADNRGSIINTLEQVPALLWFPAGYLLVSLATPKKKPDPFVVSMIAISFLLVIYLQRFGRSLIPYNLAWGILILQRLADTRPDRFLLITGTIGALAVVCWRGFQTCLQNVKTRAIIEAYTHSESGKVFIPDNLFLFDLVETCQRRNTYTNLLRSRQGREKPALLLYPEIMRGMDVEKDTNMLIQIDDQSWICVQSATSPAEFIVEKTILPGSLNRRMADRTLIFDNPSAIFLDSTAGNRKVLYANRRPYIKAAIRQTAPHNAE